MILTILTAIIIIAEFGCVLLMVFADDRQARIELAWWFGIIAGTLVILHSVMYFTGAA